MIMRSPGESESQKQEAAGQVPGAGGGAGDRASSPGHGLGWV